jgi:predicted RNase H-like HicB family nuclease
MDKKLNDIIPSNKLIPINSVKLIDITVNDDGLYIAKHKLFKDCVASGKSQYDAIKKLEQAVYDWLEVSMELGIDVIKRID